MEDSKEWGKATARVCPLQWLQVEAV